MGDPVVTFDLRQGRIFVGDGEELAKLRIPEAPEHRFRNDLSTDSGAT